MFPLFDAQYLLAYNSRQRFQYDKHICRGLAKSLGTFGHNGHMFAVFHVTATVRLCYILTESIQMLQSLVILVSTVSSILYGIICLCITSSVSTVSSITAVLHVSTVKIQVD